MKHVFTLVFLFLMIIVMGQSEETYFNPKKAFSNASKLYSEGKNDAALELLNQIDEHDSVYISSAITKMIIYLNKKDYEKVINIADQHIGKNEQKDYYFLLNKSVALMRNEEFSKAARIYEDMRKKYPYNYLVEYNYGVCFEQLEKYEKAIEAYKRAIILNPTYQSSHLRLGNIYYRENQLAQTMLCYNTFLLINPTSDNALDVLNTLNTIVSKKNESEIIGLDKDSEYEVFSEINLLLKNYVALNKKYKTGNDLGLSLVKQNHLLLTKLSDIEEREDFWGQKYVKLYKELMAKEYFNEFIYWIMSSTTNVKHQKILKRNKKGQEVFAKWGKQEWINLASRNNIDLKGNKEKEFWYEDSGILSSVGDVDKDGKQTGEWKYYSDNGELVAVGVFKEGKKEGKWEWFHNKGKLKEYAFYKNGKLEGENKMYFDNGKIKLECFYKNDSLSGEYKKYNAFGALIEHSKYKSGQYHGHTNTFYALGSPFVYYSIDYKEGEPDGVIKRFTSDGKVNLEMEYDNGTQLTEIAYYSDGSRDVEYSFENGKLNGVYKSYYYNGQLHQEGKYLDNKQFGKWKDYYFTGELFSETEYNEKGELSGVFKTYDRNGNQLIQYDYKKGDIKAYIFYDSEGEILKQASKKKGKFFYEGYNKYGINTIKGTYLFEGGKDGEWLYYSDYGFITGEENFKEGEMNGWDYNYYGDGKTLSYKSFYTPERKWRKEEYFYANGKLRQCNWTYEGELNRFKNSYYLNGKLRSKEYYRKGSLHGVQEYYTVESNLHSKHYYNEGRKYAVAYYDYLGEVTDSVNFYTDSTFEMKYPNGKIKIKYHFRCGIKHGDYTSYYFSGKVKEKATYNNGALHGDYTEYYEDGKIKKKGAYLYGDMHGTWEGYHENGTVYDISTYNYGDKEGESISYTKEGIIYFKGNYVKNQSHGLFYYYSDGGELELVRRYEHGILISYTYQDSEGNLLPEKKIEKGMAKVVTYHVDGSKARVINFVNGDFQGDYEKYYNSGQLAEIDSYLYGYRHGESVEYFENGKVKIRREFVSGYQQGKELAYYENGQLKYEKKYIDDTLSGIAKFYNKEGKLIKQIDYKDGEVYDERIF